MSKKYESKRAFFSGETAVPVHTVLDPQNYSQENFEVAFTVFEEMSPDDIQFLYHDEPTFFIEFLLDLIKSQASRPHQRDEGVGMTLSPNPFRSFAELEIEIFINQNNEVFLSVNSEDGPIKDDPVISDHEIIFKIDSDAILCVLLFARKLITTNTTNHSQKLNQLISLVRESLT